jgi:hypothetical protein
MMHIDFEDVPDVPVGVQKMSTTWCCIKNYLVRNNFSVLLTFNTLDNTALYFYNHITISIKYSEQNIIYVTTWANPIKTGSDVY